MLKENRKPWANVIFPISYFTVTHCYNSFNALCFNIIYYMKNNPTPSTGKPTASRVRCQVGFFPPLHLSQSIRYLTTDIIWAPEQVIRVSKSRIGARGWVHGLRPQDL